MTALAFMTLVIGLVVGSVVGIALTFYRDTKVIRQIIREYEAENARKKNEIEKYRAEINRYNSLIVSSIKEASDKCKVKNEAKTFFMNKSGDKAVIVDNKVIDPTFWDVKFVPDDVFGSDIDFGGNF